MKGLGKKTAAVIISAVIAVPLISCGSDSPSIDSETTETADEIEVTTKEEKVNLPDDLDFNGETTSITFMENSFFRTDVGTGELNGEIVNDAIYNRNTDTEYRLNLKIEWLPGSSDWDQYPLNIKKVIMAGESPADIVFCEASRAINIIPEGYFRELSELPYIDYNNPWWYGSLINNINTNGKYYQIVGAYSLATMVNAYVTVFNKGIYENFYGDVNQLYDLVIDKKWTLDRLIEYASGVYIDVNGNSTRDSEDTFGCVGGFASLLSRTIGLTYEKTDSNGNCSFDIYNDKVISMVEKMRKFFWDDESSFHVEWNYDTRGHFADGRSLFYFHNLEGYSSEQLRAMTMPYGVVPNPVLEENMDTFPMTVPVTSLIPVTVPDNRLEIIGAVLENMAFESHKNVVPAWYEIALKDKISENERDKEMIELVYNNLTTAKFCIIFPSYFYNVVEVNGSDQYSSYYESQRQQMEETWSKVINW